MFSFLCFTCRVLRATGSFREAEALFEFSVSASDSFPEEREDMLTNSTLQKGSPRPYLWSPWHAHLKAVLGTRDLSDPIYLSTCNIRRTPFNLPRATLVSGIYPLIKCSAKAMPLPHCQTPAFLYCPAVRKVPGRALCCELSHSP